MYESDYPRKGHDGNRKDAGRSDTRIARPRSSANTEAGLSVDTISAAIAQKLIRLRCAVAPVNSRRDEVYKRLLKPTLKKLLLDRGGVISNRPGAPFWCTIVSDDTSAVVKADETSFQFRGTLRSGESVTFDIPEAMNRLEVNGLALIFFMGLGDYFFSTPLLAALRRRFPELAIHAYVSKNFDSHNSPLVGKLLQQDPNIDRVEYYDGKPSNSDWRNYDYSEVLNRAPDGFLVIPMIYDHGARVRHRVLSLFKTFSLPKPRSISRPIVHTPSRPGAEVEEVLRRVLAARKANRREIVFLQLEARSSNYTYPYADELAIQLVKSGYVIVSATPLSVSGSGIIVVDTKKLSITDSIHLLRLIHEAVGEELTLLTITSVFGSVSTALEIINLQMWHFDDPTMHTLWYPNIHLIAKQDNPAIPQNCITVATEKDYSLNRHGYIDYKPEFVIATLLAVLHPKEVEQSNNGRMTVA
jgi:hypothetical protein